MKAGIVDPTKVARSALQNAASIGSLILTTEALIADKPAEKEKRRGTPASPEARRMLRRTVMDRIRLNDVTIFPRLGVAEIEKEWVQKVTLDLELLLDLSHAATTDDVHQTVDYESVYRRIHEVAQARKYHLIESLAGRDRRDGPARVPRSEGDRARSQDEPAVRRASFLRRGGAGARAGVIALVALGANLGDRERNLVFAATRLRGLAAPGSFRASHLYETRPWGGVVQPDFLNAVVRFETSLDPEALLALLQAIEREAGTRARRALGTADARPRSARPWGRPPRDGRISSCPTLASPSVPSFWSRSARSRPDGGTR